jgi:hypothetical protein
MNCVALASSTLDAVAYHVASWKLAAPLRSGGAGEYSGVPHSPYRGVLSAPSAGKYSLTTVKRAAHRCPRVP